MKTFFMQTYSEFRPTPFDVRGLGLPDKQDWLVLPVAITRDSGPLAHSNFSTALKMLGGESASVEIHRFGHWGPGWFEIIIVCPETDSAIIADEIESTLESYPVLDDEDATERELIEASKLWKSCYNDKERLAYIRKHRSQFDFSSMQDLMAVAKGKYFTGYASELVY